MRLRTWVGSLILPISMLGFTAGSSAASLYKLTVTPTSTTVTDGTTSTSVSIFLDGTAAESSGDTTMEDWGVAQAYLELNVTSGNGTLDTVTYNSSYFILGIADPPPTNPTPPPDGEISGANLLDVPGTPDVLLLGTFTLDMPVGGTTTVVTLSTDPNAPFQLFTDDASPFPDTETIDVDGTTATFTPLAAETPVPMAVWGGLAIMGGLGLMRKGRGLRMA